MVHATHWFEQLLGVVKKYIIIWTNIGQILYVIIWTNVVQVFVAIWRHQGPSCILLSYLTHWGWVTHICVSKLTTIGSDNGLLHGRRQAIIWTIAAILFIGPLGTNFNEILIGIQTFFHSRKCIWKCHQRNGIHLSRPQYVKEQTDIFSLAYATL